MCHVDTVFPGIGITFEPGIVQGGSPTIAVGGIIVAARLHPDVRRHVHQVSGGGDESNEAVGSWFGKLGPRRCLHGVNIEVIGGRVVRVMEHDPLENRAELGSSSHGLSLESPVVPWLHADHGLSGPDLYVRV